MKLFLKSINNDRRMINKLMINKTITITDIYVGHSTDITMRKNQHKSTCNKKSLKIVS